MVWRVWGDRVVRPRAVVGRGRLGHLPRTQGGARFDGQWPGNDPIEPRRARLQPHVLLEASAADGFAFSGFGGSCTGMVCELDLSEATAISASFAVAMDTLTVRIRGDGRGRVVSAPTGIDCPAGA